MKKDYEKNDMKKSMKKAKVIIAKESKSEKARKRRNALRRGQLTLRALELIAELALVPLGPIGGVLSMSGRPTMGRALYVLDQQASARSRRRCFFSNLRQVENVVYKLKRDGLICEKESGVFPLLTQKGSLRYEIMKERDNKFLPPPTKYKIEADTEPKVFIFDVPEKDRFKRDWLRIVLRNLKYIPIQKSAWYGTNKFPQEFIIDLEELGLLSHVHIFPIKKQGTIGKLGNIYTI
ncbi:MAG: hypothetical protein ABH822_00985 [Patescibacteria group bacterium]